MTPKEKAQDIWMKLFQKQIEVTGSGDGNLCVEMALIAVDELIENHNKMKDFLFSEIGYLITSPEYWQ